MTISMVVWLSSENWCRTHVLCPSPWHVQHCKVCYTRTRTRQWWSPVWSRLWLIFAPIEIASHVTTDANKKKAHWDGKYFGERVPDCDTNDESVNCSIAAGHIVYISTNGSPSIHTRDSGTEKNKIWKIGWACARVSVHTSSADNFRSYK